MRGTAANSGGGGGAGGTVGANRVLRASSHAPGVHSFVTKNLARASASRGDQFTFMPPTAGGGGVA